MIGRGFVFAAVFGAVFSAVQAEAGCRQALALALDVSGSVDAREYRLQLDGLAAALNDPVVRAALLVLPARPVEILIYEWSGPSDQALILDWTPLRTDADIEAVTDTLAQTERRAASPGTALGSAMSLGAGYLQQRSDCDKRTLDVSGDGKSNLGPRPKDVRDTLKISGITINGLVIGADAPASGDLRQSDIAELSSYFDAYVIMGPDAFVETALGYADYAEAMRRKLLREIETLSVSALSRKTLHQ